MATEHTKRLTEAWPCQLTPYIPNIHGVHVLLDIWSIAASKGEHLKAFGPVAASPQGFVTNYTQHADIMLIHRQGDLRPMIHPIDLFAMAWLDDVFFPARARVHALVLPIAREGFLIMKMARMLFDHLFDQRGFQLIYEIIPATYTHSLRLTKACGFEHHTVLEKGAMDPSGVVDGIVMVLTRKRWHERGARCRG